MAAIVEKRAATPGHPLRGLTSLVAALVLVHAGCAVPAGDRRALAPAPSFEADGARPIEEVVAEFGGPRRAAPAAQAQDADDTRTAPSPSWMPRTGPGAPMPPGLVPRWASRLPSDVVELEVPASASSEARGAALGGAMNALAPGQMLAVAPGTYALPGAYTLDVRGTADRPIVISGAGGRVVLTHRDGSQNVMNIGRAGGPPVRYVALAQLEVTGGSQGLRIISAEDLWIDACRIHDTGDAAITANTQDTRRLTITRNEIWGTSGTGEGMYLGANNAAAIMSESLVAYNHVHDTGGRQGDGIEIKQGSWGNRVLGNLVHDTRYPAILLYGTGGEERNVVEGNVCFRAGDNVMQVQGEALVVNNLVVASTGGNMGFESHDHQGAVRDLELVNNTIVNDGVAARFMDWAGRPGLVLANNAFYSRTDAALLFPNGSGRARLRGNVVRGSVRGIREAEGFVTGFGLDDFIDLAWDAESRDARPSETSALIGAAAPEDLPDEDLSGRARGGRAVAGCLDAPPEP